MTASTPARRRWTGATKLVGPLAVFVLLMAGWYAISYLVLDDTEKFLLPPPHEVLGAFFNTKVRTDLLAATWVTSKAALIGLLIAFVLGSITAIAMAQARWVQSALYPYVILMQTIPILAIVPVIGFWFGYDLGARVIVCVIIAIFPLVINPLQGLLGVDRGLNDLFTLGNASRWTRLVKLQLPNAAPDFFVGLQSAAGLAVTGSVVGDFYFGRGEIGLGLLLSRYSSRLMSAEMLATVIMACLLGLAAFWIFGALGRRLVGRWSQAWGAA
jgi:NitT/TauT family transport system permease protein